jgi:putative FmdB family regulatory protein
VPTYGYRCTACGHEFDVWQRMSDEAGAACPSCGAPSKRLIFPAGIVFKGSGFYKTDSRGASSASSPAASTSSKPDAAANGAPAAPAKESPSAGPATTPAPSPASGGGG